MIFCHKSLEIGSGDAVRTRLMLLPFDKEAIGNTAKHAEHQNSFVALNAAPVVVVGNIEPLVKAALNAPTLAVEFQPAGRIESLRRRTGDPVHPQVVGRCQFHKR